MEKAVFYRETYGFAGSTFEILFLATCYYNLPKFIVCSCYDHEKEAFFKALGETEALLKRSDAK